jgi:hypothetical protein
VCREAVNTKELGRLLYVKLKQAACGGSPGELSEDALLQAPSPIVQDEEEAN